MISTVRDTLWRSTTKVPPASLQVLGDIHTIDDCRSLKVVKKLGATEIVAEAAQAAGSVRALTSTFTCGLCATSMGRRKMRRRSSGRNRRSQWQRRASALSRCCWPKGDRSSTRCLLRNLYSSVTRLCHVAFPEQRSAARELPNKLSNLSVEVCQAVRHGRVRRGCGCGGRALAKSFRWWRNVTFT